MIINLKSPYVIIGEIRQKIKKEWKIAFFATIIIGLIAHLFIMVNQIPNHDCLHNIYSTNDCTTLGRWFLQYVCGISSYYSLTWVNSMIAILCIALTSVVIVELFDVKKSLNIILISGILVTYPTIAATFSYMYTIDGYMIGLLFASLSVLLAYKYKYGFLVGSLLICCSLGIYQSYISVTVLLCIFKIMMTMIDETNAIDKKDLFMMIMKNLIMGILGFVLYYVVLKIALQVKNMQLSSYQDIQALESISVSTVVLGIKAAISNFFRFPLQIVSFYKSNILIGLCNIIICIMLITLYIKKFISQKSYKKIVYDIVLALCIIAIPIGTNLVMIISVNLEYHLLMRYS